MKFQRVHPNKNYWSKEAQNGLTIIKINRTKTQSWQGIS